MMAVGVFNEAYEWLPAIVPTNTSSGTLQSCGQFIVNFCQTVVGTVPDNDRFRFFADTPDVHATFTPDQARGKVKISPEHHGVGWYTLNVSGTDASYAARIFNIRVPAVEVTSQWDDGQTGSLGPFLYSVPLQNTFTIKFPVPLPSELKTQYRVGEKGAWNDGTSFTLDVGTLPAGQSQIDIRILDPGGRTLYFYDDEAYIDVKDDLPSDLRFTDRPNDANGRTWNAEDVRFMDNSNAGLWQGEVVVDYIPIREAYKDYDFELSLTSKGTGINALLDARFKILTTSKRTSQPAST